MRLMRALASLYVVATLLSLTPSLFASNPDPMLVFLQVNAQVQSVPYNQPMYLGPDPVSTLATRGVYGNSAASAAETLQFQQSLLSSLGVRPGVQLVNAEAFSGLAPAQLQDQVLQKQYDIINQLQQQNPYLNRAAQPQQQQQQQPQQAQQPLPPQQQQQMQMQTGYVAAYPNAVNSPQAFGSINSPNGVSPMPNQGNNYAPQQLSPPQQQFPQQQGFQPYQPMPPQQQLFQQQPQQPLQQPQMSMNQPYSPLQSQPLTMQQPNQMMAQQQQQFQPQQPSFPQQQQQQPFQPTGFANNAAMAPPMLPRMNNAAAPSAASTASTPSVPIPSTVPVRPASTAVPPVAAATTPPSSATSAIPSTPPKPRPTSCADTDYHCQFYQSCYGCYGNHSLPYCGSCLTLLQCNDDVSCQMVKAKAVCQQLSAAKEPQSQGCKQLMAMN